MLQERWNSVQSPKNDEQGKAVWDMMAFPVPAAITGACDVLSWAGWALLAPNLQYEQVCRTTAVLGESPAPFWKDTTNFGMISGVFRAIPDASPGNELGISSTAYTCSASFVYILRICL